MKGPTIREVLDAFRECKGEDRDLAIYEAERLAERVEAVLALHVEDPAGPDYVASCATCGHSWPCPTIRALDGEP